MNKSYSLKLIIGVMLLIFLLVYIIDSRNAESMHNPSQPAVVYGLDANGEERVADFTLHDLAGKQVSLSNYEGRIVYLNFWATWCKWCKKEMPDIQKIHEEYEDKGVTVLAISVGEESVRVSEYIAEHQYSFRVLLDPNHTLAEAFAIKPIPVSIFLDSSGEVVYRKLGYMKEEEMKGVIDGLLSSSGT